jgi:hypothetical protein
MVRLTEISMDSGLGLGIRSTSIFLFGNIEHSSHVDNTQRGGMYAIMSSVYLCFWIACSGNCTKSTSSSVNVPYEAARAQGHRSSQL